MIEKVGEMLLGFALKRFEKDAKAKKLSLKIQQCIKVGELEKARDFCFELMGLRHDNPYVYSLLATVQYELKEYDKCLKSLQEAIRLQPSIHSYWELKGDVLKALDRLQEAIDAYNQAIKLNHSSQSAKQKRDACQSMLPPPPSSQPSLLSRIGRLGNQDFGSFSSSVTPPSIFSSISSSSASNIELRSAKGIDYRELEKLLKAKEWRKADEMTAMLMLQVAEREQQGWLNHEVIEAFPCEDLRTIDQLWVHYSNSKFGFSIQKKLWIESGGEIGKCDYEVWKRFAVKVGWCDPQDYYWRQYQEIINDTKDGQKYLLGYLPYLEQEIWSDYEEYGFGPKARAEARFEGVKRIMVKFFARVETCRV
ncbi:MAG: GUN4 domain-containing protein [Pseudanabaenaceae cyanobacterium]|jgi:tetratricopeptide (TPR) repeat protein